MGDKGSKKYKNKIQKQKIKKFEKNINKKEKKSFLTYAQNK